MITVHKPLYGAYLIYRIYKNVPFDMVINVVGVCSLDSYIRNRKLEQY